VLGLNGLGQFGMRHGPDVNSASGTLLISTDCLKILPDVPAQKYAPSFNPADINVVTGLVVESSSQVSPKSWLSSIRPP